MLSKDTLQQLSQLKNTIRAQREIYQGVVRATPKRFGFVRLDDGREAFLDPEQMLRVLPDDRVEVELKTNDKNQLDARLEKLISSSLGEFVGRYVCKGNGHFVEPDLPFFNRWLFIPPQERNKCSEGDLILCEIIRHPFNNDGKAQVRIIQRIGRPDEPGIESRYILAKYQLPNEWTADTQSETASINWTPFSREPHQQDLTHLPFVTIDSETTRDMDDAVYVERNAEGWTVYTAIADPTRHISPGSALEKAARERASTVYLLGQTISMLPIELAHDIYSLVPEKERPALVCRMQVDAQGVITDYEFFEAVICSRNKLSYQSVYDLLTPTPEAEQTEIPTEAQSMLHELHRFALARIKYRAEHALVMEERADYFYILNEQKKIERVEKKERNIAHRVVEEAMLATNICAGELFVKHPGYGIFSSHLGFRAERLEDALSLINEDRPDLEPGDLTRLENFQRLFKELRLNPENQEKNAPLLAILQRLLQAAALTFEPSGHFGLGFSAYATVTSPIRRYNDLFNHFAIKRILNSLPPLEVDPALPEQLQEQLAKGRQACRQIELWLVCQFMTQHIGSVHRGTITQVNSVGVGVRLEDLGVEGFVTLADKEKNIKTSLDARRFCLTAADRTYQLDQQVSVMVDNVDVEKRRIGLTLVSDDIVDRLSVWSELPSTES
ncbi:MAG: VacB/RNase II family 3'-5' exoribonuclease [Cellvibrio sp.]|jgi:VacB and RNase II family 3''-5'' exoribonucleases